MKRLILFETGLVESGSSFSNIFDSMHDLEVVYLGATVSRNAPDERLIATLANQNPNSAVHTSSSALGAMSLSRN